MNVNPNLHPKIQCFVYSIWFASIIVFIYQSVDLWNFQNIHIQEVACLSLAFFKAWLKHMYIIIIITIKWMFWSGRQTQWHVYIVNNVDTCVVSCSCVWLLLLLLYFSFLFVWACVCVARVWMWLYYKKSVW